MNLDVEYIQKQEILEACLKNHSCNLHAPFCGTFVPNSVVVARYAALIRDKFPTNCDAHLAESIFQTHPRACQKKMRKPKKKFNSPLDT